MITLFYGPVILHYSFKKVNRNIHGVPQSQAAANLWHQEEDKKDRNWKQKNVP